VSCQGALQWSALIPAVPVVGEEEEEDDDYSVDDDEDFDDEDDEEGPFDEEYDDEDEEDDEEGGEGGKTNAQVLSEFYNVRARWICPDTTSSLPGCLGHLALTLTCDACAVAPT